MARLEGIEPPTHGLEEGGPGLFRRGLRGSALRSSLRNGPRRTGRLRLQPPLELHPPSALQGLWLLPRRDGFPQNTSATTAAHGSNPCFSLERAVTWPATTLTYGRVATSGCHRSLPQLRWMTLLRFAARPSSPPAPSPHRQRSRWSDRSHAACERMTSRRLCKTGRPSLGPARLAGSPTRWAWEYP
jgi:hypothetical protein